MTRSALELVVRGDDAGATVSANKAVAQCFREGVLTCASVMVAGGCETALADAAERLTPCVENGLCIGLHVTLNSEWSGLRFRPVSASRDVPSLVGGNGCFLESPQPLQDRGFSVDEAMTEVSAQLECLRAYGLKPRYLDEHLMVGWLPNLRGELEAFAEREGMIAAVSAVPMLPAGQPDIFDPVDALIDRLRRAGTGRHVWVTHPLIDNEEAQRMYNSDHPVGQVADRRDRERRLLLLPRLRDELTTSGVCLCSYL